MDVIEAILTRRSIRQFKPDPVTEDQIKLLLEAAMSAPSAGNQQPWQFLIITERGILDEIPKFHPHARMLASAPIAILVCAETGHLKYEEYWVEDCSAATQNILLAAHGLGLGAVWVGLYPKPERMDAVRGLITLPEHVLPVALVPVGHPGEFIPPAHRFDESRIHRNRW